MDLGEGEDGDVRGHQEGIPAGGDGEYLGSVVTRNLQHITVLLIRAVRAVNLGGAIKKVLINLIMTQFTWRSHLCCMLTQVPSLHVKSVTPDSLSMQSVKVSLEIAIKKW